MPAAQRQPPPPPETLSSEPAGRFEKFSIRRERVRAADGAERTFDVVEAPPGVVVVAITAAGEMLLVAQWRQPLRRALLELPAGEVEPGETPAEAALRELREETGYEADEARILGCVQLNPSWQDLPVHLAAVTGARRAGAPAPDAGEDPRLRRVPPAEALRMAADGRIQAAPSVAALAAWQWSGAR
jgi:ADP-ribose pyrophosphatase